MFHVMSYKRPYTIVLILLLFQETQYAGFCRTVLGRFGSWI